EVVLDPVVNFLQQRHLLAERGPQLLFSHLAIFDICDSAVPLDDLALLVAERHGPDQEPAVFATRTAMARLVLERLAGRERSPPLVEGPLGVIGVKGGLPAAAVCRRVC